MTCLAVDIGTTHWKAAVIRDDGRMLYVRRVPAPLRQDSQGASFYEPGEVLPTLQGLLASFPRGRLTQLNAVALTGMAEAGLLLHGQTHQPLTPILPWFDTRCMPLFASLRADPVFARRHPVTGLPNSYKYSVYKILAALQETGADPAQVRWLGVAEYAAFLFTGSQATDPTFAARTYAYDIGQGRWDESFLAHAGLPTSLFPPVLPSGAAMGALLPSVAQRFGLPCGIPVAVCGHDHLCAAYGAGITRPGQCFSSMGTAQVLIAPLPRRPLTQADASSGLSFGPGADGDSLAVLGSIQAAGGSVNWLHGLLYGGGNFRAFLRDAAQAPDAPSGLLFYPYLSGSGAPHLDPAARGGMWGLRAATDRGQLILGVYEGLAMEARFILASQAMGSVTSLSVCGGLTAHPRYLQILSDVLALPVGVLDCAEGSLYGAARLAHTPDAASMPIAAPSETYVPRPAQAAAYAELYHQRYVPLMRHTGPSAQA